MLFIIDYQPGVCTCCGAGALVWTAPHPSCRPRCAPCNGHSLVWDMMRVPCPFTEAPLDYPLDWLPRAETQRRAG